MTRVHLALAALALTTPACGLLPGGAELNIPITGEYSSDEIERAEALVLTMSNDRFPNESCYEKSNARAFVWIAAAKTEPATQAAALDCMYSTFTHTQSVDTKEMVNADYKLVVSTLLDSPDDTVRARAIEAARVSIDGDVPDNPTIGKLVGMAGASAAQRYAVLDTLWYVDSWDKDDAIAGVYIGALDAAEPYVVSAALSKLRSGYYNLSDGAGAYKKVEGLLAHDDPGVRGRALEALAAMASKHGDAGAAGDAAHKLLKDGHPYVRSEAAGAVASLKREASIHQLMNMIEDSEKNTYDIEGFKLLDGSDGRLHHDGSAWSRVDDAVFSALKTMTYGGDDPFDYQVKADTKDQDLADAVDDARAWYDRNKDELPPPDADTEAPDDAPKAGKGGGKARRPPIDASNRDRNAKSGPRGKR
jgi:hypothetical protein